LIHPPGLQQGNLLGLGLNRLPDDGVVSTSNGGRESLAQR
jgi:hypothetical protein